MSAVQAVVRLFCFSAAANLMNNTMPMLAPGDMQTYNSRCLGYVCNYKDARKEAIGWRVCGTCECMIGQKACVWWVMEQWCLGAASLKKKAANCQKSCLL